MSSNSETSNTVAYDGDTDDLLKEDDVSKIEHMETSPKRKTSPIKTGKSKINGPEEIFRMLLLILFRL